jgi:hypothetical protein
MRLEDDKAYDVVFSNSVLEHVGPENKQEEFAAEVRRLGISYWIQTPSPWFPLECHTGLLFWFFYPSGLQEMFYRRWRRKFRNGRNTFGNAGLVKAPHAGVVPRPQIFVEEPWAFPSPTPLGKRLTLTRASRRAPHALGFSSAQKVSK